MHAFYVKKIKLNTFILIFLIFMRTIYAKSGWQLLLPFGTLQGINSPFLYKTEIKVLGMSDSNKLIGNVLQFVL